MNEPNTELLTRMAEALGELRERMVFVGGCATALLITDPAAAPVRATQDMDAVVAIASKAEYLRLGKALRARGFSQTLAAGEPPYRWYEAVLRTAVSVQLPAGPAIRLVTPACFLATKLAAFIDRGREDYREA